MKSQDVNSVYFVGIGGIGMSALARYFHAQGVRVYGYDRVATNLTQSLENEGIEVIYDDEITGIHQNFLSVPVRSALVVFTPAIASNNAILGYFQARGYNIKKRSQVLGDITSSAKTIAIAGTHGKTTISSILAHVLHHGGIRVNAFLGGISMNFGTNFILDPKAEFNIVEADEFDRSFHTLNPYASLISTTDADHLDIYGSAAEVEQAFAHFADKTAADGHLLTHNSVSVGTTLTQTHYGIGDSEKGFSARNVEVVNGAYQYEVFRDNKKLGAIRSTYPGRHNVENALGAIAMAVLLGLNWNRIKEGIETFKGVKRRFETHIRRDDFVFIDDYAHHPKEIQACVNSVKELHPEKRITGVFQPHLFSRTRDFADDFARSLETLHDLLLMEIYPAREEPIEGVDSTWLLNKIENVNKKLTSREELVNDVLRLDPEVLLTMGAGDIDKLIDPLKVALNKKHE